MPTRFWIATVVVLAIVVAVVSAALQALVLGEGFGIDRSTGALLLGELAAVGFVAAILEAFNRRLWRIKPFSYLPWPDKPPDLRGTWPMTLTVEKEAPHQKPGETKKGSLVLDQTASVVKVTTYFADGDSCSTQAILEKDERDKWTLNFFYKFILSADEQYWGAARLTANAKELDGDYWNERGGKGRWRGKDPISRVCKSRDEARKALAAAGK